MVKNILLIVFKTILISLNFAHFSYISGSTEGNSNIINVDNHVGACGFMPLYMTFVSGLYPLRLLRVDENGQLLRDENGFCIRCKPGEAGEIVRFFIFE